MTAATTSAPAGLASRLFASGALAFFLLGVVPALFGVALPLWAKAFGLAEGQGGALLATYNAGAGLTVLAAILGVPGLTMRPALLVVALGGAILALGSAWGLLLLGGFVAGLGYGVLAARVNRRFLQEFGPKGPGMVSLVNGIYGLGSILAPLLFLAAGSRPSPILWMVAVLALLAMALGRPEPFRVAATGLPPLSPRLLLLLINFAGVSVEVGLIAFGAAALVDMGMTEPQAARLVSAFFAAFVASRLGLAAVSHRLPPDLTFLLGIAGTALACGLAASGAPAIGFVLAGAFVGICFPSVFVWISRLLGPDPRMGAAILAAGSAGGTLGPLALRPILGAVGVESLFWILSVFGVLLTVAVAALLPRLRRLPAP
jgi:fucose permease